LKFPSLSEWLPSGKPSSEPGSKAPKGVRRQPVSMPMLTLAFARRSFRVSRRIKKIAGATSSSSSHRCYGKHRVLPCDSFVNSQEWTLSRSVPDIRLGIVGSLSSGKSALVHRYLTGSYMQDESPEGGRFKKEIVIDGQSYLLLIRDEGGPPELQVGLLRPRCVVGRVASTGSLLEFSQVVERALADRSDTPDTMHAQNAISESNPRVIDDLRARKLASDLKRCSYYETAATYGLNVERVFQDACQRIVQLRMASSLTPTNSRPGTPVGGAGAALRPSLGHLGASNNGYASTGQHGREVQSQQQQQASAQSTANATAALINSYNSLHGATGVGGNFNQASLKETHLREIRDCLSATTTSVQREIQKLEKADRTAAATPAVEGAGGTGQAGPAAGNNNNNGRDRPEFVTPCSTPTTARKTRRRSNLFTPLKKADEEKRQKNGEMGSGRVIPVRQAPVFSHLMQGYLYKKSIKALNKEWKKKYVTLTSDGRLTYHPSLHDYMEDVHGKEIPLMHTTVKIPGQKPRGSRVAGSQVNDLTSDVGTLSLAGGELLPFFPF
ncbi:unnamed protein product, partial [Ixodes pacificus]